MIRTVAITGGIGAGKSTVGSVFKAFGYPVIDADLLARQAMNEPSVIVALTRVLGSDIMFSSGMLDRAKIRDIVFRRPDKRLVLESIVHPEVERLFQEKRSLAETLSPSGWLFYEIPLLFETGKQGGFDAIVVVTAPLEERVARVIKSRGMTADDVRRIIAAQVPDEQKVALADFVIDNGNPPQSIDAQCLALISRLRGKFCASGH